MENLTLTELLSSICLREAMPPFTDACWYLSLQGQPKHRQGYSPHPPSNTWAQHLRTGMIESAHPHAHFLAGWCALMCCSEEPAASAPYRRGPEQKAHTAAAAAAAAGGEGGGGGGGGGEAHQDRDQDAPTTNKPFFFPSQTFLLKKTSFHISASTHGCASPWRALQLRIRQPH